MSGEAFFKPSGLSVMFRSACSECGSAGIRWMHLVDLLPQLRPEDRSRGHELVGWVGPDADAWLCSRCGGFGAFGPTQFEGF